LHDYRPSNRQYYPSPCGGQTRAVYPVSYQFPMTQVQPSAYAPQMQLPMQGLPMQGMQLPVPTSPGAAVPVPSGAAIPGAGAGADAGTGVGEESYIENILRFNRGKMATFYYTYENNTQWNAKIYRGRIETAGRDHIIISDPQTGRRYLLLTVNLDWVEFDGPIAYVAPSLPPGVQGSLTTGVDAGR